ncbi:MAG: DUF1559 domain-containing protein [Rhodopirellula sp.]|nr:DUF1559 domain-containing protein [Rhodopirellula sp.]
MPDSNNRNLTCPNGHTFGADELATSGDNVRCPECGVGFATNSDKPSARSARSLWEVMGRTGGGEVLETGSASDSESPDRADEAAANPDDASAAIDSPEEDPPTAVDRPRGLWAMMGAGQPASKSAAEEADVCDEDSGDVVEDDDFELADDDEEDGWEVESPLHDLDAANPWRLSEESGDDASKQPSLPRGSGAVAAGIVSVLLAGLNLLPSFVARIPATAVGAYALLLGYQTLGSNRRLQEPVPRILAPVGMFLGLIGIFAGPAYLVELGDSWRNRSTREVIESHLGSIHKALNDYAIENGHFPAGGTFAVDEEGLEVGMHSWMTSLLPYLGHSDVYDTIDQSKPWNDDANSEPMSHSIPTFLIPSVPHEPTGRGFATTHFAGVGGLIQTDQGLLPTGIFNKNSAIRIEDVTDGMSQTLIAGEIARALPAWGDPENWRTIEGPLNQRLSSFGNAAGTGAHFLQGDGSVRFFSNKTSPEVLQKLTTRDAGD